MIVLKLIKDNKELYVADNEQSNMLAIEYGWEVVKVSIANNKTLNNQTEIK